MKMKVAVLFAVLMLLISVSAVFAQDQTIVDVAAGNEDFSTLVSLVQQAGLADALATTDGLTVFAPTNEAFAALPPTVVEYLTSNPELLTQVLQYHVVEGRVLSTDLTDGLTAAALDGSELIFTVNDEGVLVNNAAVTTADIAASNGVIHVIDTVLLPPVTLPEVFAADVIGDITVAGSSTVLPLTTRVANDFSAEGYASQITVEGGGSGAGFERFCVKADIDIADASRAINEEEVASCAALATPRTPIEIRVGTDALAVVVNPANDFVDSLTLEQLAQVFGGAETWADVDASWPDEPILRFIPGTDSGTFDYFVEEVFDEDGEPIQGTYGASTVQLSEDDNVLLQGVSENPYAIGFFGYAYYAENPDALKVLSIEGVEPSLENVDNNSYPLARPLFIYTDATVIAEKPQVGQFVTYYLNIVNDVVVEVGYFPANEYALRLAKLAILAATEQTAEGM